MDCFHFAGSFNLRLLLVLFRLLHKNNLNYGTFRIRWNLLAEEQCHSDGAASFSKLHYMTMTRLHETTFKRVTVCLAKLSTCLCLHVMFQPWSAGFRASSDVPVCLQGLNYDMSYVFYTTGLHVSPKVSWWLQNFTDEPEPPGEAHTEVTEVTEAADAPFTDGHWTPRRLTLSHLV